MTLDEFVDMILRDIHNFRQYWEEQHVISPKLYPLALPKDNVGEWWEMFMEFSHDET